MSAATESPTPAPPEAEPAPLPDAVPALFPAAEERQRLEDWLTREFAAIAPRIRAGSVTPTLDLQAFGAQLQAFDFNRPRPLEAVLRWTLQQMEHGLVQMSHPGYFGLFNPGPHFPAQCADRIVNMFNPQLASSASSPVPVAMERHTIECVGRRAGLGASAAGHFATGGSEANYTALICALTRAHTGFAADGARAFAGPPRFYASRECHIAWAKIAHQAGVGRSALRLIDTDGTGRLDAEVLRRAIRADRAQGAVPVMLVATAGTTGGGLIDPLGDCAEIAREEGLWYHVDAAWGGAALASDRLRPLLAGIEKADSITIDAHKWFATTMGCALFLTQQGHVLAQTFHASTNFMPSAAALDPYLTSVQWSRRFLGLRLFVALASAGWAGMAAHVERSVAVIEQVKSRLLARGWTVVNDSPLAVLNAVPPPGHGDVLALVRRVVASGQAWVAFTTFEGREVVRICATHGETSSADIDRLIDVLDAV
jgi:glutamate/tyrosine decarboxylase-like PLP-dependent enzyme